ncbi:MAG: hypothetical protein QCH99_09040 [Candidatus Bathyarchaeota archaeon]|nr:hypothetical protein [Candidatus Bathyarchaeum tardum]WGM90015.1 MAG: hypothetical protein NUK63_02530 [Candidatus Bathyarchaeum tardum]
MKQALEDIKQNLKARKKTDRIMWFSMWAVLAVASFGIAWFPMIYYSIKRRNNHFARQENLEILIRSKLNLNSEKMSTEVTKSMNATLWTLLTLLIVPGFYLFYSLKKDLQEHEMHEHVFLSDVIKVAEESGVSLDVQSFATTPSFRMEKYFFLSVLSCGLVAAYWLYRIFNDYNDHFKMQWIIEDELLRFLKELEKKSS